MSDKTGTCPSCKQTVDFFSGRALISGEGFSYPQHLELPRRHLCNCESGKPCHGGVKKTDETWCSCRDIVGTPRLCPGCRSLDGEHDFGPTCTLTEE